MLNYKGKVFPYTLWSIGPGADPNVQAICSQVSCHYFLPGLLSHSQQKNVTVLRPVPSYTAWWQRHILPKVETQLFPGGNWIYNLLVTSPTPYCYASVQYEILRCVKVVVVCTCNSGICVCVRNNQSWQWAKWMSTCRSYMIGSRHWNVSVRRFSRMPRQWQSWYRRSVSTVTRLPTCRRVSWPRSEFCVTLRFPHHPVTSAVSSPANMDGYKHILRFATVD